jgi:hypothetical protein
LDPAIILLATVRVARKLRYTIGNDQHEIALRHTRAKKNKIDGVRSTPYVPFADLIAFVAFMNETIKPYLAAKDHSAEDVRKMHSAGSKSLQLQPALSSDPYSEPVLSPGKKSSEEIGGFR